MFEGDVQYAIKKAKALVGYQIVGVCEDKNNGSYGLVIQQGPHGNPTDEKLVWIDRDPEGNGPGWITVEAL